MEYMLVGFILSALLGLILYITNNHNRRKFFKGRNRRW